MKPIKIKIIAGAVTLALAGSASNLHAQPAWRADGYTAPYAGAAGGGDYAPFNEKLYLGLDAGPAWLQGITISDRIGDSERVSFAPGARLDMMVGYKFTENWAAEFEMGLIANEVSHSQILGTDYMGVTYLQMPLLVNGIYTLPLNKSKSLCVFVGAGVGGVFSKYTDEFGEETAGDSAFAFQGQVGFKWAINQQWDAGVAYKFLGTTRHDIGSGWDSNGNPTEFKSDGTMSHSILAKVTFKF